MARKEHLPYEINSFIQRQPRKYTPPKYSPIKIKFSPIRVLYFTDAHDRHDMDKERFKWLGKYCADNKPDIIVNGGDTFDVDSLNRHVDLGTKEGGLLPDYELELISLNHALEDFAEHCPDTIPIHITLGNHEQRVYDFENSHKAMGTILSGEMEDVLRTFNYQITPYRSVLDIEGVWFTHCPHNAMRKPIGGINGTANAAKASPRDIVFGHTHKKDEYTHHQSGYDNSINNYVRAYNGGCFMPHGLKFNYAKASQTSWHYGFTVLSIFDGKIIDTEWVSMLKLESMYG